MHDADRSLGRRGASRGCEPIPLFAREHMTLDEDVRLENNAHRCILDPVCLCVCLVLYHIVCIHKEIDTNEGDRQYKQKKRDKEKKIVCICVCARASTHTHTQQHT